MMRFSGMNKVQWWHKAMSVLFAFVCFVSCSSEEKEVVTLEAPRMTGSVPADGTTGLPESDLSIVLTFDQNVTAPSSGHERVSVTGATVSKVTANLTQVTILVTGLAPGNTYQLVVPEGVILGPTKVSVTGVRLNFATRTVSQPDELSGKLCTPDPSKQAQKLYAYLTEIYGKKTLSGTMANVNWNTAEAELVYQATGKYPAINFFDYIHLYASPADWIDYGDTRVAEQWWNEGGIIGAGWHWMVPVSETAASDQVTYKPEETTFRAVNALTEGTWENRVMNADLKKMAGYLHLLKDKNIPVIWRPLHEAAGNTYEYSGGKAWFWWGADGSDVYRRLWIRMFEYFAQEGLDNLIWVWTTQLKDDSFYPGDEYVDIVGRDIYNQENGASNAAQYQTIVSDYGSKPVTLSECGSVATLSAQWNAGARWSYFMPWYQYDATSLEGHEHAGKAWWLDAMRCEFVVSRADLPSFN